MYAPPHFRQERDELLHALRAIGAVNLITETADSMQATFLPILVTGSHEDPVIVGHIARANPQWREARTDRPALAVATGPNNYVTPNAYPSKATDPKVVPTWNYVHVQAHGRVEWITDEAEKLAIVSLLTDTHEVAEPAPWAVSDAPADYISGRLRSIVGLRLHVTSLEGSFKLSQNQSEQNRTAVIDHMRSGANAAVGEWMERTTP